MVGDFPGVYSELYRTAALLSGAGSGGVQIAVDTGSRFVGVEPIAPPPARIVPRLTGRGPCRRSAGPGHGLPTPPKIGPSVEACVCPVQQSAIFTYRLPRRLHEVFFHCPHHGRADLRN